MQIGPVEIFAAPSGYIGLDDARNMAEAAINSHNRRKRRCPLTGRLLESIQDGLNETIRVEASDVAPLTRKVFA